MGLSAEIRGGMVVFAVEPVGGRLAGTVVEVGVAVEELGQWPRVPPHWVHLPEPIELPESNRQPSEHASGWWKYSRPHPGRFDAQPVPARAWVAHVRALLGEIA